MSEQKNAHLRRGSRWFVLLLKRQLKRPFLWVIALFMVISVLAIFYVTAPDVNNKRILLYSADENALEDSYSQKLIDNLLTASQKNDTIFEFERIENYDALIDEVTRGSAECGFVLSEDFDERIALCDTSDLIEYVSSNYTTKGEVARETVFAEFFEIYGKILIDSESYEIFGRDDFEITAWLTDEYDRLLSGDDVFNADYQTVEGIKASESDKKMQPVRGLVMILITMALLLNGSEKFYGSASCVSKALPFGEKTRFEILLYITGIIVPGITGFVLIRILDPSVDVFLDILLYIIFVMAAVIWTFLFSKLLNNAVSYMAWIMTFLIAQVIICPVWQDVSEYVPSLKPVSYLFPAGAYLRIIEYLTH
ncbi:hypothetical protein [Butyrivibrio fibrisolvens]|uniref:ABC-2 family transporter protein n=1 Tax=Butyrivibrio fibrisolvens TaxID=831 RepID=A0A317FXD2_BUTFI|nr:hypothetical protein [Butyrivibrio fibrisolvens]PWT26355.1 hypothetical protein CPT75_04070 [Butyrivibrio fibrisolvens]